MLSTLIISTYNRPDALAVCLDSVRKLAVYPDEVIIGDDGSTEETRKIVEEFQKDFPVPLKYIWQEDEGFRLAAIRNKCIAAAKGDYIIQIDGDIFLHPMFVADHLQQARPGFFLKGGRVQLDKARSEQICKEGKKPWIHLFSSGIEAKRANTLRFSNLASYLAPRYRKNRDNVLGCNMSFYRKDLIAVNGYDEDFTGWGGEDLDLSFRLRNAGIGKRYLKFCALAYHLWHREASMDRSEANHAAARNHRSDSVTYIPRGLSQYLLHS
ncbi:MAG: glycosyltransferase family 2 protein [Muribaculaceae bacterium]|nr:glycosyltransferase family 2 protein [Muribaculaceae bacterium]